MQVEDCLRELSFSEVKHILKVPRVYIVVTKDGHYLCHINEKGGSVLEKVSISEVLESFLISLAEQGIIYGPYLSELMDEFDEENTHYFDIWRTENGQEQTRERYEIAKSLGVAEFRSN